MSGKTKTAGEPGAAGKTTGALDQLLIKQQPPPEAVRNSLFLGRIERVEEAGAQVTLLTLGRTLEGAASLTPLNENHLGQICALQFIEGDWSRPLIIGLMWNGAETRGPEELHLGGRKIALQAGEELELRCGESVIRLRRDGRIEIRGNYITSQAAATQRLKGGSIHLN